MEGQPPRQGVVQQWRRAWDRVEALQAGGCEFTSGIKSSCCGNDISMKFSSVDRCRIAFAFELILLKV